jgi:hypothetical protein
VGRVCAIEPLCAARSREGPARLGQNPRAARENLALGDMIEAIVDNQQVMR